MIKLQALWPGLQLEPMPVNVDPQKQMRIAGVSGCGIPCHQLANMDQEQTRMLIEASMNTICYGVDNLFGQNGFVHTRGKFYITELHHNNYDESYEVIAVINLVMNIPDGVGPRDVHSCGSECSESVLENCSNCNH